MFRVIRTSLGTTTGWQRAKKSSMLWEKFSFAVARAVSKQLLAIQEVVEPAWTPGSTSHSPYTFVFVDGLSQAPCML